MNEETMPDVIWASDLGHWHQFEGEPDTFAYIRQSSIAVPDGLGEALDRVQRSRNNDVTAYSFDARKALEQRTIDWNLIETAARELQRIKEMK